jgi:hypothetical protein
MAAATSISNLQGTQPSPSTGTHHIAPINLTDLRAKVSTSGHAYTAKKVAYFFAKALAKFGNALSLCIFAIPRAVSYVYNHSLVDGIKAARLQAFQEGLKCLLSKDGQEQPFEKWDPKELFFTCHEQLSAQNPLPAGIDPNRQNTAINDFLNQVFNVKKLIDKKADPDTIRKAIDKAMSTPVYQALKRKEGNPAVELLQILAVKELSAKGAPVLIEYGKKVVGPLNQETFSFGELADVLDTAASDAFAFQRNNVLSTAVWTAAHPLNALHSQKSRWLPLEFNSHDGNPNFQAYEFVHPKNPQVKMQFYFGPGPTGDHLYNDGVLVYIDKLNGKGIPVCELRENFQNIQEKHEAARIVEMLRYREEHPSSFKFISLSFDTPCMKMKGDLPHFQKASEFLDKYKNFFLGESGDAHRHFTDGKLKNDNGVFIGDEAIQDDQSIEKVFTHAEKLFTSLSENNPHWNLLSQKGEVGKKRLGRMMQLGVHGLISLCAVYQSLESQAAQGDVEKQFNAKLDEDLRASRVSGACKQDIDRAIVENVTLRLFFHLLTNDEPLSQDEVYSIVGAVIGRARLVEGRLIIWKRYEILSDLLHFVGEKENLKVLSEHLKTYVADISTEAK